MRVLGFLCVAAASWAGGCVPGEIAAGTGGAAGSGTSAGGSGGAASSSTGGAATSAGGVGGSPSSTSTASGGGGAAPCGTNEDCPAATDCVGFECVMGACEPMAINEGAPCGSGSNPCASLVCISGTCSLEAAPDGTMLPDDDPTDCLLTECKDAQPVSVQHSELCQDQDPTNCILPSCSESGACLAMFAPEGSSCTKSDGQPGTCTANGACQ